MKVKPAERTESVKEYYFSQKLRQIDQMRSAGTDIINLGIGSPDQPPSENTISRLKEEAMKPSSHGYQSYTGIPALRKAFAEWYKKYFNVTLDPGSEILPLMGSKEGIMHISMAYVNPGDEVLVPNPGYPTYSSVTSLTGGKIRYYDLTEKNGWQPDLEQLDREDLSRVKIMWINYPHMPTGAKGSVSLFEKLVAFASGHGFLLCNDNPYSFILNRDYLSLLSVDGAKETALELNSLSKSHNMAGWRIGMVAGHSEYISNILKVKSNMDSGMFRALQTAAVEALGNPPSWYDTVNSVYTKRRIIVEEIMNILNCSFDKDQSGLFVWGRIPDSIASCELFVDDILNNAHVFITPGFIFGSNGDRYIRISLCADEKTLSETRRRIVKYLDKENII
ncbi:MAG TPA: aminotransferase class I/II-fold pyridoxal phosphate-dependent enzyme [Bacteroidales bacterium]|nr:aminotransferase class I/II-fold pyridoxal phosphate-dependent enzyme [Bacteroidales bacterium]HOX73908.1 aminotransferase class I/II-fold pyridoxal phosphate-dependent enzyme [Bacteroidales bacterium]HPM88073.1 aminotransferase class I/II-fold pyridoxal phosphate-dependent enzyme [Bacteroidales bacterium]HQM68605.1 aminotransferase class I/II-fold pyridoxal phosphate-dependent enzyme [Bacteroidales bacterium]